MSHLPVVMLAGGLGTRVSSIAGEKPKALLPLAGVPFLQWKLNELISQGVTNIYLLLGYGAGQIEEFLDNVAFPLKIVIIRDEKNCKGTGQAIFDSLKHIKEDQFILTYGDNLLPIAIGEFTNPLSETHCRMVTTTNVGPADKANAQVQSGFVVKYGKEQSRDYTQLDYGYSVISKACLAEHLGQDAADLAPAFSSMAKAGVLEAHSTNLSYTEIGTPMTYFKADEQLRNYRQ
jgi:D-glycero-alpha-D-manno-heptose 1-phosphate guanylyltransferase